VLTRLPEADLHEPLGLSSADRVSNLSGHEAARGVVLRPRTGSGPRTHRGIAGSDGFRVEGDLVIDREVRHQCITASTVPSSARRTSPP
jgi:hypothetical protein